MTTRVCPLDKEFYDKMVNTPPNKNDFKEVVSPLIALQFYAALNNLHSMIVFIAEHKELANILEENEDGTVNTQSLPREMRPQFEVLIRSIQSSLKLLEK